MTVQNAALAAWVKLNTDANIKCDNEDLRNVFIAGFVLGADWQSTQPPDVQATILHRIDPDELIEL